MMRRALHRLTNLTPHEESMFLALVVTGYCGSLFSMGIVLTTTEHPGVLIACFIASALGAGGMAWSTAERWRCTRDLDRLNRRMDRIEERRDTLAMLEVAKRRVLLNQDLTREQRIEAHAALTEAYETIVAGEHQTRGKL